MLGEEATQEETFDRVAQPVVQSVVDGFNGTVFAYGQTGSGKTYTLTGGADSYASRGIIPRAISAIFAAETSIPGFKASSGAAVAESSSYTSQSAAAAADVLPNCALASSALLRANATASAETAERTRTDARRGAGGASHAAHGAASSASRILHLAIRTRG